MTNNIGHIPEYADFLENMPEVANINTREHSHLIKFVRLVLVTGQKPTSYRRKENRTLNIISIELTFVSCARRLEGLLVIPTTEKHIKIFSKFLTLTRMLYVR